MIRDFLKEGSIYAFAGIAAKGVSLFMIPIFTYYFTTLDFGRIEILFVFTLLISGILSWQLGQGLIRYISQHQNDQSRKKYYSSTAFIFTIAAYFVGTAVLIVLGPSLLEVLGLSGVISYKTFVLTMIAVFLNGIFSFFGNHLQALRKKNQYAISNFIHSFLGIIATYLFVIVLDKSINGIFYATIATVPVTLIYQFSVLKSEYRWFFSRSILRQLLSYSIPLIPGALALIVLNISDRVMLSYLTSLTTLGIYSVALKFAFGMQIIVQGFGMAINPLTFEKHQSPETNKSIGQLLSGYIKLGGVAVLILSLFSKEIVVILTQSPYYNAQYVMPMLFASVWIQGVTMFALGLQITKKTFQISIITCLTVILNVALNYYLIPIFDIKGAAFSTLISASVNSSILVYFSRKSFPLKLNKTDMVLLISVLCAIILFSSSLLGDIFAFATWAHKLAPALILAFSVIFYFSKNKSLYN